MSCVYVLQVHFEGSTVAQIVYSGDQADRGQQQVVYTADGNSYTSVESAEHTLVYIHPADGTQVRSGLTEGRPILSNLMTLVKRTVCIDRSSGLVSGSHFKTLIW